MGEVAKQKSYLSITKLEQFSKSTLENVLLVP